MNARPLLLLAAWFVAAAAADAESIEFSDCRLAADPRIPSLAAECGTLTAPLDPNDPELGTIELFIARVAAASPSPKPDPITVIVGGPGQGATETYPLLQQAFARINRERDVILVDQRGTGKSARLGCELPEGMELETMDPGIVAEVTQACLDGLDHPPQFFTTSLAVRDLDRVRETLGVERWNLYGISYGTRVVQHYLRRYPEHTRAAILDGVVPPDEALGPDIALRAQAALERVFARCSESTACSERFGDVGATFDALLDRLEAEPVSVALPHPLTGDTTEEVMTPLLLTAAVRMLSYSPNTAALLPVLLDRAAAGEWAPITGQAVMIVEQLDASLAYGMHNSVVCSEDIPFVGPVDRAALEATYLGTNQVDTLEQICAIWPDGPVDGDLRLPLKSAVPVLLLSGSADPITPPDYAERARAELSQSRHIVATDQGHGIAGLGCVPRLMAEFIEDLDLAALDPECLERQRPMPFFLSLQGPAP